MQRNTIILPRFWNKIFHMSAKASKRKGLSISTLITLIMTVFVIAVSGVLGTVLSIQSIGRTKEIIENKTLELARTAAALLDGDSLMGLQKSDVGSEKYMRAFDILKGFRASGEGSRGELAYIYCCRAAGNGKYEYTIDPDPVEPTEFGEEIEWTYALGRAAEGYAAFDIEPYTDQWGTVYSAYAPVFDSNNNVAMIVGIDVWADWYNASVWSNSISIIIATSIAAASGVLIGIAINISLRKRFEVLSSELTELEQDVQGLLKDIKEPMTKQNGDSKREGGDQVGKLHDQILSTQKEIKEYIIYTQKMAYIDALARTGNRTAYVERIKEIDLSEPYAVCVFDINGLKYINDHYGHEDGDDAITEVGAMLKESFGDSSVYRIGGDEFVVILMNPDDKDVLKRFSSIRGKLEDLNRRGKHSFKLNISQGIAFYDAKKDTCYKDTFHRADEAMYKEKEDFYQRNPDLRKKYGH